MNNFSPIQLKPKKKMETVAVINDRDPDILRQSGLSWRGDWELIRAVLLHSRGPGPLLPCPVPSSPRPVHHTCNSSQQRRDKRRHVQHAYCSHISVRCRITWVCGLNKTLSNFVPFSCSFRQKFKNLIGRLFFGRQQWQISGRSKGGAPPMDQNFLNFMQFFRKSGKFVIWRPPPFLEGWHPLLRGILDPPWWVIRDNIQVTNWIFRFIEFIVLNLMNKILFNAIRTIQLHDNFKTKKRFSFQFFAV